METSCENRMHRENLSQPSKRKMLCKLLPTCMIDQQVDLFSEGKLFFFFHFILVI